MHDFHDTLQHATLTWVTLAVEILAATLLYAGLYTLGTAENTALLISSIAMVIFVFFGLIVNYRVIPSIRIKRARTSFNNFDFSGKKVTAFIQTLGETIGLISAFFTIFIFLGLGTTIYGLIYRTSPLIIIGVVATIIIVTLSAYATFSLRKKADISSVNSDFNMNISSQSIVQALKIGTDAVVETRVKQKVTEREIEKKEWELKLHHQELQESQLETAEERDRKQLLLAEHQLKIQQQLLELYRELHDLDEKRVISASETAKSMVDNLVPKAEETTKKTLIQMLLPDILRLSDEKNMRLTRKIS